MKFLLIMDKISQSDAEEDFHVERISPKRGSLLNIRALTWTTSA